MKNDNKLLDFIRGKLLLRGALFLLFVFLFLYFICSWSFVKESSLDQVLAQFMLVAKALIVNVSSNFIPIIIVALFSISVLDVLQKAREEELKEEILIEGEKLLSKAFKDKVEDMNFLDKLSKNPNLETIRESITPELSKVLLEALISKLFKDDKLANFYSQLVNKFSGERYFTSFKEIATLSIYDNDYFLLKIRRVISSNYFPKTLVFQALLVQDKCNDALVAQDKEGELTWRCMLNPKEEQLDDRHFRLTEVKINYKNSPKVTLDLNNATKTSNDNIISYSFDIDEKYRNQGTLDICFEVLQSKHAGFYTVGCKYPTKIFDAQLTIHEKINIETIEVLSTSMISLDTPTIAPPGVSKNKSATYTDWVIPPGCIVFSWSEYMPLTPTVPNSQN